jgi:hypothetical protein
MTATIARAMLAMAWPCGALREPSRTAANAASVAGEPSLVNTIIGTDDRPFEPDAAPSVTDPGLDDSLDVTVDEMFPPDASPDLPLVSSREALAALDYVVSSADAEAVEFFINSALTKLWKHAFKNDAEAVAQVQQTRGNEYIERCRKRFLAEYQQAKDLVLPDGYAFRVAGQTMQPFLMQRLIAVRMRDQKRVGNWSGPGAGKTLSAVLASRVAGGIPGLRRRAACRTRTGLRPAWH